MLDADLLAASLAAPAGAAEATLPAAIDVLAAGRLRRWSGILASFLSVQALVQGAGLAAGLLFVNFLPVEQFAFYTFASSVFVTLCFATDLGSSSALLHFFHRGRATGEPLAPYVAAIVALRRALVAVGAPIALVALVVWGAGRGEPPPVAAIVAGLVVAAAWWQIPATLGPLRLRLDDRYAESYRAEGSGAVTRLVLAAGVLALGWRQAAPAFATAVAASVVTALLARSALTKERVEPAARSMARRAVVRYLLPTLPGAFYFAIQGQFVVWLAATFAGTRSLAEVGALGRLGLVIGVFSSLAPIVFLPRLARLTDERLFARRYLQFGAFLAAIAGTLLGAAALAPHAFLALLGPSYRGLDRELLLVVASAGVTLVGGYAVAVNNARSWTRWQVGAVAFLIVCQVALATALPLGTTEGLLWFGLGSNVAGFVAQLAVALCGFVRPSWVMW